jgi:hypothetical protein
MNSPKNDDPSLWDPVACETGTEHVNVMIAKDQLLLVLLAFEKPDRYSRRSSPTSPKASH